LAKCRGEVIDDSEECFCSCKKDKPNYSQSSIANNYPQKSLEAQRLVNFYIFQKVLNCSFIH
jgi:hypothetical protein